MVLFLICLCAGVVIYPASGAGSSETYGGYLGDTINLYSVSYVGSQVFLFFTGPNLLTNGETLLDRNNVQTRVILPMWMWNANSSVRVRIYSRLLP